MQVLRGEKDRPGRPVAVEVATPVDSVDTAVAAEASSLAAGMTVVSAVSVVVPAAAVVAPWNGAREQSTRHPGPAAARTNPSKKSAGPLAHWPAPLPEAVRATQLPPQQHACRSVAEPPTARARVSYFVQHARRTRESSAR